MITINIVNFDNIKLDDFHTCFHVWEYDQLTETVEIIFYEMPKLEQQVKDYLAGKTGTEDLSEEQKWCIYMRYRHEELAEPLIKELCQKEEGIMYAEKALSKVDRDYAKAIRRMNILIGSMDHASAIYNARLEGEAKGDASGYERANLEVARKMKAMGDPPERIQAITGLSVETLKKL